MANNQTIKTCLRLDSERQLPSANPNNIPRSTTMTYTKGLTPVVTVYGPGNLHHLSYASSISPNAFGMLSTTREEETNFLLGFSFSYNGYAF
ncbi:hypothetical protein B0H13DRAFT_2341002 [Mycena leptocephala]|nr:hypothetical protein B0H13DRAFT_2341002 [Mycena leptocephala]